MGKMGVGGRQVNKETSRHVFTCLLVYLLRVSDFRQLYQVNFL